MGSHSVSVARDVGGTSSSSTGTSAWSRWWVGDRGWGDIHQYISVCVQFQNPRDAKKKVTGMPRAWKISKLSQSNACLNKLSSNFFVLSFLNFFKSYSWNKTENSYQMRQSENTLFSIFRKRAGIQSLEKNCSLIWVNPGLVACYPGPGAEILLYSAKTDSLVELRIYRPREEERRVILYNTQWPHLRQHWYRNTDTWCGDLWFRCKFL